MDREDLETTDKDYSEWYGNYCLSLTRSMMPLRKRIVSLKGLKKIQSNKTVYTAAHNDALTVKPRVRRVISELRHDVVGYNRQASPSVKDDWDEKRRLTIG